MWHCPFPQGALSLTKGPKILTWNRTAQIRMLRDFEIGGRRNGQKARQGSLEKCGLHTPSRNHWLWDGQTGEHRALYSERKRGYWEMILKLRRE